MKVLITFLFLASFLQMKAQSTTNDTSKLLEHSIDSIYSKPEVEAKFKKGSWADYLERNMTYPDDARKKEIQGIVTVQYIIEGDGAVSNVRAISGPIELRGGAENLIRKSPKWTPALNNGKAVRTLKKQPIVYRLTR